MEETKAMLTKNRGGDEKNYSSKLPESPRLPMEFLSRSWSLPALQLSKALSQSLLSKTAASNPNFNPIFEEQNHHSLLFSGEVQQLTADDQNRLISTNSFSFASAATSQLVLDRIMSQSEVSPMTSGRPSCSEPQNLNGIGIGIGGQSFSSSSSLTPEIFDSPTNDPISPPVEFDKFLSSNTTTPQLSLPAIRVAPRTGGTTPGGGTGGSTVGSKTVGRWLKERKEKKKEESRVHNAQLHAAVSVAAVAAAVAATASATASVAGKDETDVAIATAATLVAARCVEAAEAMGAEREHLASVISSAVNVQSHGDIMTLTAAAATALRGAATLKARTMKEVCNIAAVLPVEKGLGFGNKPENTHTRNVSYNEELLSRGSELLKRTRKGELHLKLVSVYIDKTGQVILKMKSRHVAGTITKKKKKVLMDVIKDMPRWGERRFIETRQEDKFRYFGLKTTSHRVIQFECKTQEEYDAWTQGVSRLLSITKEKKKNDIFSRNDIGTIFV